MIRKLTSCLMILLFPLAVFAADNLGGMLYTTGTTWLNGTNVPQSSAVFPGDIIQTKADSLARIAASGSSLVLHPDSLVRLQPNRLELERGGVVISTSKGMAATAEGVTIKPSTTAWTEFEVLDANGSVRVAAYKGDVLIASASGAMTLPQGQSTTASQDSPTHGGSGSTAPAAKGPFLTTKEGILITAAAIAGLILLLVLLSGGGHHNQAVTTSSPGAPLTP